MIACNKVLRTYWNQTKNLVGFGVVIMLMTLTSACLGQASTVSKDQKLLTAIQSQDLSLFKSLLEEGANPNAIFGSKPTEWVMCMAMHKKYEAYMKLVLEHGGDINLRNTTEPLNRSLTLAGDSAPLLCSIRGKNYAAFNALMERGVRLDIKVCRDCEPFPGDKKLNIGPRSNFTTPIITAMNINRWEMVYRMIEKRSELRLEEINRLIYIIERGGGINKESDANQWRLKVAEKLNAMGHKITVDQGFSRIKVPKWGEDSVF